MKKIIYLLIALAFMGCNEFLDVDSNDLLIPKDVEEYSDLLFAEAHLKGDIMWMGRVMCDDVKSYQASSFFGGATQLSSFTDDYFGYYTWQQNPEHSRTGKLVNDETWTALYRSIVICNTVINDYDKIEGDDHKKEYLKAEAHFLRAIDYFYLVNFYAPEYAPENLSKKGVPINDKSNIEVRTYVRNTIKEVYDKITSDLISAEKLLKTAEYKETIFNLNYASLYQFMSRVYLYMKDYDNVIKYAGLSLNYNNSLVNLNSAPDFVFNNKNSEINFCHLEQRSKYPSPQAQQNITITPSDALMSSYSENDLRKTQFFVETYPPMGQPYLQSSKLNRQNIYNNCFRVAEVYLNRAEAYAEKQLFSDCVNDLNTLRANRLSSDYEVSASNKTQAIDLVKAERRRELCYELHRWFDLRRWGKPSFDHVIININETTSTYRIEKNDPAYILPLPVETKVLNPNMKDYPNPVRQSVN